MRVVVAPKMDVPFFFTSNTNEAPEIAVRKMAETNSMLPDCGISTGQPTDVVAPDENPGINQVGVIGVMPCKDAPEAIIEFEMTTLEIVEALAKIFVVSGVRDVVPTRFESAV